MDTSPDEDTEDMQHCDRCGDDYVVERYHYRTRSLTFCVACDWKEYRAFQRDSELRDFCHGCAHLHLNRQRACTDPHCTCDGHMSITRRSVLHMMEVGTPATIVGWDGSMADIHEVACARCGCPISKHVPACAGCSWEGVIIGQPAGQVAR